MQNEFKIVDVLKIRGKEDEKKLVFKVEWHGSNQIAYMQLDMAKKKYPQIVLEYLVSKIKQKPANLGEQSTNNARKGLNTPVTQHSENPIIVQGEQQNNQSGRNFRDCLFCSVKNQTIKILDYDVYVPQQSMIAYPAYFKLPSQINKKSRVIKQNSYSKSLNKN